MIRSRESTLVKKCLAWVNKLPKTYCYKRKGGPGRRGEPDISGCSHGIRIEIEIKTPGEVPTPIQQYCITRWKKTGAIAEWTDHVEKFQDIILTELKNRDIKI